MHPQEIPVFARMPAFVKLSMLWLIVVLVVTQNVPLLAAAAVETESDDFLWWRDGVIYQIYPRSFLDTTGDGIGDLNGIIEKLDYLAEELGVTALWLSPIYPSPDVDFGYDVSDHKEVDPKHGTLADFDRLVEECRKRGIRIILDLVLNHTSDQHPWFLESASDRTNPKHDWYMWSDTVPNNWLSIFGSGAWKWHEGRQQFYYHMFFKGQPDVNWHNPQVRTAQLDVVRFWLERGVDGFRLDVFNVYFKDKELRSNPRKSIFEWDGAVRPFGWQDHIYDIDQPEMDDLLIELRQLLNEYPDSYAVGEPLLPTTKKVLRYMGDDKLHAAFQFDFLTSRYDPGQLSSAIRDWEEMSAETGLWPNYVLSNHDAKRSATRYTGSEDDARPKVMMALLLTMRGTPFLYNGEEIGQRDISLRRREVQDPVGKKFYPLFKGRDGSRAPVQWDASDNAGFTSGTKPWLKVHPDYKTRNVAAQQNNPDTLFTLTQSLIALRKQYVSLRRGELVLLRPSTEPSEPPPLIPSLVVAILQRLFEKPERVLAYLRKVESETILVALNFDNEAQSLDFPAGTWNVLFSKSRTGEMSGSIDLFSNEVLLLIAK